MQQQTKPQKTKTKVRFTSLDVAAVVSNMQSLIGMRASNIYDINPTTYMIKLAKSQEKTHLLIENGIRFHTTEQKPDKKAIPSGFTMKFRKFLRSKRLEGVRQVGVERVVVFTFGSEAFTNHLILELYSQGNIILTDNNYRILQCIRSHEFNDKVKTAVGQIYPFEHAANIYLENIAVNEEVVNGILEKEEQNQEDQQNNTKVIVEDKKKKKNKNKGPMKLKDFVFKMIPCLFPLVIEHILLSHNKNPEEKVTRQNRDLIVEGGKLCLQFLKEYMKSKHKGYLFEKLPSSKKQQSQQQQQQNTEQNKQPEYFEFSSYKNTKYKDFPCREYPTFNEAVNEYFLKYKSTQHQQDQQFQEIAWKKYDQIKRDQNERVRKLQEEQEIYKLKAQYIEKNVQDVDAIIKIIKTMQDNGYSWEDISRMIEQSKKNGDPLANSIHEMNIYKRLVVILLGDPIEQQQNFELLPVEINIDYNAYTNATMYYESKKKNFQKQQRTKEASEQVLKVAHKEAVKKIEKKQNETFIKNLPQRKVFWFQKFNWFISSEGYLIISGRDSHQNELVVKRYMKPGDLYMHADYGGAASTIIKKHVKEVPVPRNTLEEAAIFTVCRSKAWQTKILSGAWWVYHDQVSKSAPTGEFLPTGSFMIRGKRNFIQPNRMEMGLTMLFKVDNESAIRHINDRKIHEEQIRQQEEEQNNQNVKKYQYQNVVEGKTEEAQEEFAIVSIDTQTKKQRQQEIKQQKLQKVAEYNKKKQELQKKTLNADQPDSEENSNNNNDDSENEDEQLDYKQQGFERKKSAMNNGKKNQNMNGKKQNQGGKKIEEEPPQEKHKQRKKKKLKKLEKYLQEQDEEEREIIMRMLGAKQMKHMQENEEEDSNKKEAAQQGGKKKKKDKKANKKNKLNKYLDIQDDEEQMSKLNPDKVLFLKAKEQKEEKQDQKEDSEPSSEEKAEQENDQPEKTEEPDTEEVNQKDEGEEMQQKQKQGSAGSPSDQEEQEEEPKEETDKKEEQQQEAVDDAILDSQLGQLYKLVGKPHPQDQVECLVAMCAPYLSIKDNRFKVKLVPGSLKKGKAARNILHFFSNSELNEQQKGLVKSVPEQELINAVIGNVKLAGAGLLKMEMKNKNEKKQKRKQEDNRKKEQAN